MRLTSTHLRYWQARKTVPSWAPLAALPRLPVPNATVDECIRDHAGERVAHLDASNLLSILRLVRKRESMVPTLQRIALDPGTSIRPERRAAFARKWLRRIAR